MRPAMKRGISETRDATASPHFKKLPREFFNQPAVDLSKALLGKVLARKLPNGEVLRGTIVETEAYPGTSLSNHRKRSARNAAMFMEPGTAYVYFTYGMYHCFNISAQEEGGACLLRAVEPLQDYASMRELRDRPAKKKKTETGSGKKSKKPWKLYELANGPGKLCLAFDIDRGSCDKQDLVTSDLMWLENSDNESFQPGNFEVEESKRVGIDSSPPESRNQLWRFLIVDNLAVSTAKPHQRISETAGADEVRCVISGFELQNQAVLFC